MRIIAGKYKKMNLFSVSGFTVRPTTDYTREMIFSVLYSCENLSVLDIFAGSGSLGLEAISRGAEFTEFVEFSEKAIQIIKKNILKLDCREKSRIHRKKVSSFLQKCNKKYDLIFMDPPYNKNLVNKTIDLVFENSLLKESGRLIIEHSPNEQVDISYSEHFIFQKKTGETMITILIDHKENS